MKGGPGKQSVMERTRHTGGKVSPFWWEAYEKVVEIITCVIIEEYLKLGNLRSVSLALVLGFYRIDNVLHCQECVRPRSAA